MAQSWRARSSRIYKASNDALACIQVSASAPVEYTVEDQNAYISTLEHALEAHAGHPALQHTYDPTLLSRAPALAEDIAFFLRCPVSTWQSNPAHTALLLSHLEPLEAYESRIRALSESDDAALLLAHAYVRYLGDLSGGQTIQRRIARAYGLDVATGNGMRFYSFGGTDDARSTKELKEWYRAGMNTGVGDDVRLKGASTRIYRATSF